MNTEIDIKKSYLINRISANDTYEDLLKFPRYFEIETVHACNAKCKMCTINDWARDRKPMKDKLFDKIAEELIEHAGDIKRVSLYRDGEPLLDPKLPHRIAVLKDGGVKSVAISTNLSLLGERKSEELLYAGLDILIMSIDSLKKEIYEKIRCGLIFENVMENAIQFFELRNRLKSKTQIWVRMIAQEENRGEWSEFKRYWSKMAGKKDRVYSKNIFNWGGQLGNFKAIAESYEPLLPCVSFWSLMPIFNNGVVPLCNADFNGKHVLGDLTKSSIEDIWRSDNLTKKRNLHLNNRKAEIEICRNCNVWDEPPECNDLSMKFSRNMKNKIKL